MNKLTRNKDGSLVYDSGDKEELQNNALPLAFQIYIDNKMKVIYWIIGVAMFGMLAIFITVALPLQNHIIEVIKIQQLKAFSSETDALYLKKQDYYLIEEDEHRILKEAIKSPIQTDYLMTVINDNIKEHLGFKTTSGGPPK